MGYKATIIEIYKKLTTYDKKLGVIVNGVDNQYPERVDRFINNSVTAKTCAKIMKSYLRGKGWGEVNDKKLVNENTTLQKFTEQVCNSASKQRGFYVHVSYNANFVPSAYNVLPYTSCRLGKKDDDKYNGKIGVSDKWGDDNVKNTDVSFYDVFNPDKAIVSAQINKVKGDTFTEKVEGYKGQILYVNFDDEYIYALSQADAVLKDCDSEAQASVYKNRFLRKGYMGQKMIVTKPLVGSLEDYDNNHALHSQAENERDAFQGSIKDCIGADNNGGVLTLEMQFEDDNIDEMIKVIDIDSNITDDAFKHTEESVFNNILMSFNSLPSGLVRPVNTLFGQSSAAIEQMQRVYQENTSPERDTIEQTIQYLMSIFTNPLKGIEIIPLIEEETNTEEDGTADK